ncbi:hypothetical protein L207DRAFT_629050 [Hyaloscypha variabilis F]|uniref:Uncharacterized protein n=1 Tax=Hyaloscypha variabilis (strain UAMH 11265 / GT02V1 / F) TaxID=1149755 RepID=A0A2J6S6W8_HYAVF|nr:hypothetical protein L207DRAFT_629050 [Hyaloscypha variabilis F]
MAPHCNSSVPDPKTWRPSEKEWYPRLHIGQHWQDMSIPLYCYLEQIAPGQFSEVKWAIRPLGDPLKGKPSWTNFTLPINSMVNQIVCLSYGMKQELMTSMKVSLTAKYVAQLKFDACAPIYREQELEKRIGGLKQSEEHDTSPAMDTSSTETTNMHNSGMNTSVVKAPGSGIPGLGMSGTNTSGNMNTSRKDSSRVEGSRKDNSGVGAWTGGAGSSRSPIRLEDDHSPNNSAGNGAKRKKAKAETPTWASPTGPKQWDYFENYKKIQPSNIRR